ncbi:ABC1 kinase family protein [Candidatus Paracaedibacter symbiosus]|uniref:ABC1 kinase family protein n=1 Tax=Candidatus Paracaedibacter symbiosus TaxID=244582 RepID=UPI000509B4C2|nr:AarF/ABC1/UbiB kinase family protein [Candidatus Paracaedibacter symbiosus]
MFQDDSTLFGRFKRYARVSSAMTGLATRLAGEKYLGVEIDREQHAKDLQQLLGGLKGPLMKVAQFLATVPGALPPEYAEELLQLQSNAPAMGWAFVRRRMATELGVDWLTHFTEFSETANAAASLGQVHKATLSTGQQVACKLQYPDMESAIDADLNQLGMMLSVYRSWNNAIETSDIKHEIEERLREELNYLQEAKNLKAYKKIFVNKSTVVLPEAHDDLTTRRLLTMSWIEGNPILSFTEAPQETRNQIAQKLFHAWYYPFYRYAVIHGDPHPGNYKILPGGDIGLLDLGCIRRFPSTFVKGVIDLYTALLHNNRDQAVAAYESWGFTNLTNEVIDIITEWAKLLYDPLLDDKIRPIQNDLMGTVGWETANRVHEQLNKTTGIKPPREFVFMDRAAVGVGSVIMRLGAQANWYQIFQELIQDFNAEAVASRQQEILG